MTTLFEFQAATLAARSRLSDGSISVRAEAGKTQVVRVTYRGKTSDVVPVSDWLDHADAIRFLNDMQ